MFYSVKKMFDGSVMWRRIDTDTIEVRPIFKHARQFVEKILNEEISKASVAKPG